MRSRAVTTHTKFSRQTHALPAFSRHYVAVAVKTIRFPASVNLVIGMCACASLSLRLYQLARPGYVLGVTEYDDGVLFGNALRLVTGVIPYRDFTMVQPPGGMLLMVPAALLAKVAGSAWGLAAARLLTACADTASVVLLGVLVRHRGPLTALLACGLYAVYPDAIIAAHTFLLEPWLNMFCLIGAVLLFDGDGVARTAPRLAWAGAAFGFAVAVKIWALVPLSVALLLVAVGARRVRPAAALAGGAALGLGVPLLPFAVIAPVALVRGVLIGQLLRNADGSVSRLARLADLAGLHLLPAPFAAGTLAVAIGLIAGACCAAAYLSAGRRPAPLDVYALLCAVAVTAMFLWPRLYYPHYGAFDGPFLALAVALPAGLLAVRPVASRARGLLAPAAALTAVVLTAAAILQVRAESRLSGNQVAAAADKIIPAGACVLTNDSAYIVAADRFYSDVRGCPAMVDSLGTLFTMTGGRSRDATGAALRPVAELWQAGLERAGYVWLTADTVNQIPWDQRLYAYFSSHFRLAGLAWPHRWSNQDVPRPGLYVRV